MAANRRFPSGGRTMRRFATSRTFLGLQAPSKSQFFEQPPRSAIGAIENSLIASGAGTILALTVGILAAYGIARFGAGGRRLPFQILQLQPALVSMEIR